ncbi:MAG: haloacid dehalogenase-like hydrolase [Acidobacteria bacterium]|nr:haloacid dehalogenase-like hydrolase [Acidobacteriota bacterium]
MTERVVPTKQYLFASDFDQTLSFNDSGKALSELLGASDFEAKVAGLSRINLVQQGGELAYLLLHDPEYRRVRKEHLIEVGKQIPLKRNIQLLPRLLREGVQGHQFAFHVISAAPEEVIQSALEGIVPPENIHGTRFRYHAYSGEIESIVRVPAGYGKVAVLDRLQEDCDVSPDRVIYVGDGSSDVHVMLHVNRRDGYTIAVSENKYLTPIARRAILSDDALSPMIPILEDLVGLKEPNAIRGIFETWGLQIHEWDKVTSDWLTIREIASGEETPRAKGAAHA